MLTGANVSWIPRVTIDDIVETESWIPRLSINDQDETESWIPRLSIDSDHEHRDDNAHDVANERAQKGAESKWGVGGP